MKQIQVLEGWKGKAYCGLIQQAAHSLYEFGVLEKETLDAVLDAVSKVEST